jgi:hypothetical protein
MRGLDAGSVETFHRRGMPDELLKASRVDGEQIGADPDAHEPPAPRGVSHFAGMRLDPANIRLPGPALEGFITNVDVAGLALLPDNLVARAAVPDVGTPLRDETVTVGCLRNYPVVPLRIRSRVTTK